MHKGVSWIIENSNGCLKSIDLYNLYDRYCEQFGETYIETFKKYCRVAAKHLIPPSTSQDKEQKFLKNISESEDDLSVEMISYKLQTKEELLDFAKVDRNKWEVDKFIVSRWGNSQIPHYQLKCWLKRKENVSFDDIKDIFKNLTHKKLDKPIKNQQNKIIYKRSYLAEIGLADFHFGLKARIEETGEDKYDLDTSEKLLNECVDYFVSKLKNKNIEQIVVPIIGDFFNCDFKNATTKGTPMDEDTTYKETFQRAQELAISLTYKLKSVAKIKWVICEGNHDQYKSFYFSEFLRAWFRNDLEVEVDNTLLKRKYHKWKNNLFMYTHGDTEKFDMLPLRLAQSRKQDFAECEHYYIGVGHLHHKSNGIVRTSIDNNGIEVNILPSLVSTSKWESNKWYQHIKECICNLYDECGKQESWFYHP